MSKPITDISVQIVTRKRTAAGYALEGVARLRTGAKARGKVLHEISWSGVQGPDHTLRALRNYAASKYPTATFHGEP